MSFLLLCLGFLAVPGKSLAASAVVEFSTDKTEVKKDETVTVVCRVTSKDGFNDVKMKVSYDSDVLQFIEGGKKVSGGNGQLSIQSVGNTDVVTTRIRCNFRQSAKGRQRFRQTATRRSLTARETNCQFLPTALC